MLGLWNVPALLGRLCLIVAATAVIDHGLARLTDDSQARRLLRRHIEAPLKLGVPLLVAVFVIADEDYHPDLFPAHVSDLPLGAPKLAGDQNCTCGGAC